MKQRSATLNEIMGSSGSAGQKKQLSLDDLGDLLGERMPKLDYTPVGRLRLLTALKNRFGTSYRNLPGISDLIKEFDGHADFNVKVHKMKALKPGGS